MDSDLKPVVPGMYDAGPPPRLIGGVCSECGRKYFPKRDVCSRCLVELEPVALSTLGTIYAYTIVRKKAPFGLPEPHALGYVDLEADDLRFCTPFDPKRITDLAVGVRVALRVGPLGLDNTGQPCLRYYFTPEDAQ